MFIHLYNDFVMGLPVVNTSPGRQYQLVCTIKYSTLSQLVVILNSFLAEMGEIIRTISECGGQTLDGILIEGTFKYCPTFFMQLFTIQGTANEHNMPLVYCLLPNKTQDTYPKMWTVITDACRICA